MDAVKDTALEIPVLLAAFDPMRRGEICSLDPNHIDGNIVYAEFSMAPDENNKWVKKRPKSYVGDDILNFQISNHFDRVLQKSRSAAFSFSPSP